MKMNFPSYWSKACFAGSYSLPLSQQSAFFSLSQIKDRVGEPVADLCSKYVEKKDYDLLVYLSSKD